MARLLFDLSDSIDEAISLSTYSAGPDSPSLLPLPSSAPAFFAALLQRLRAILRNLPREYSNGDALFLDTPQFDGAVRSLDSALRRACLVLVKVPAASCWMFESSCRDIGREFRGLLEALPDDYEATGARAIKEDMRVLQAQMMEARFEGPAIGTSCADDVRPDVEHLVAVVKNSDEDELSMAILEIEVLINEGLLENDGGRLVPALLNRLGSGKGENRLKIILLLRTLGLISDENKEKMAGIEALSTLVKSFSCEADESREAVGLLLDLLDIVKVRQRIGRVQGCIVMLVMLLNEDDPRASRAAAKVLGVLSGNPQNVLLMAEAGYFVPLVQYLRKGSNLNKILMATAISRMELTEQKKAALGDEGSIEPLFNMFTSGKFEAKFSALNALLNLSTFTGNVEILLNLGAVAPIIQILFSVTSVLVSLRETAAAILANLSKSALILKNKYVAQQMLSLLHLTCPVIQLYLLQALNNIASHVNSIRRRMQIKENGALQLLLPFLTEDNTDIRYQALNLLFSLSKDFQEELIEHLREANLSIIVKIISTSKSNIEKAAAVGILSNIPIKDKKATEFLLRANLLTLLISLLNTSITDPSTPINRWLLDSIAGVMIRFTVPWDKTLQKVSAAQGVIACLLTLLSVGSIIAKSRAAASLAQLSQSSTALSKVKASRILCVPSPSQTFCHVHKGTCIVKETFCLVKAGALFHLIQLLEGQEREADEAVLDALATLVQDEIWENGCKCIEKASGIRALVNILEVGSLEAKLKALWILERIYRIENLRDQYGKSAQMVLINLAQKDNKQLKPIIAKILAQLQVLQMQST